MATFSSPSDEFRSQFDQLVQNSQQIILTSHFSPDDDSIGSLLTLFQILKTQYPTKDLKIFNTGLPNPRWDTFKFYDQVTYVDDVANSLTDSSLLMYLDANQYSRFSNVPDVFKQLSPKICIDHHGSPPDPADLIYVDTSAVSTTQIIAELFLSSQNLDVPLAESILLGILGDSGNFKYIDPSKARVFDLAVQVIKAGNIDLQTFSSRYQLIHPLTFQLYQTIIANNQFYELPHWGKFQGSLFTRDQLADPNLTNDLISEASHMYIDNLVRSVKDYPWGFVISPRTDGSCRISLRSLPGTINVRVLLEQLQIGGGHDLASGGTFPAPDGHPLDTPQALTQFLDWLKTHSPNE